MKLDAIVLPVAGTDEQPEVAVDDVEAGHVQPRMLVYNEDLDEVFPVVGEPQPFHHEHEVTGRLERWVQIHLYGVDEPLEVPATDRLDVVYGAEDLDVLAPMLDVDLLTEEQETLAFNGMCGEQIPPDPDQEPDPDEPDVPVYCGRPSIPDSYYRFCQGCDDHRREESSHFQGRQYGPTYGAIAVP